MCVTQGKQEVVREGARTGSDHQRVSLRDASRAGEFSYSEPHCGGDAAGCGGGGGAQYSGSLIPARLTMEFGREVFGVPGNVTQPVSFAPNQLIKQGATLVTNAEDVIEQLPTPVRAALVKAEQPEAEQRNLLVAASLNPTEKKLYDLLSSDESAHIDDIVERSGLNSSEVLATLFNLEMKGIVRQSPGKRFSKVLF